MCDHDHGGGNDSANAADDGDDGGDDGGGNGFGDVTMILQDGTRSSLNDQHDYHNNQKFYEN